MSFNFCVLTVASLHFTNLVANVQQNFRALNALKFFLAGIPVQVLVKAQFWPKTIYLQLEEELSFFSFYFHVMQLSYQQTKSVPVDEDECKTR